MVCCSDINHCSFIVKKDDAKKAQKILNRFFPTFELGVVTDSGTIEATLPNGRLIKL